MVYKTYLAALSWWDVGLLVLGAALVLGLGVLIGRLTKP